MPEAECNVVTLPPRRQRRIIEEQETAWDLLASTAYARWTEPDVRESCGWHL
jgi:hypothetical protein